MNYTILVHRVVKKFEGTSPSKQLVMKRTGLTHCQTFRLFRYIAMLGIGKHVMVMPNMSYIVMGQSIMTLDRCEFYHNLPNLYLTVVKYVNEQKAYNSVSFKPLFSTCNIQGRIAAPIMKMAQLIYPDSIVKRYTLLNLNHPVSLGEFLERLVEAYEVKHIYEVGETNLNVGQR